jgi:hypothetical protein
MSELSAAMKPFFQNLSMPWSLENQVLPPLTRAGSGVGLVSSLTAAAVSIGRSIATSPSSTQSWLTRKSSFRAAARTIRSVSVVSMAAVRSPKHQRVASVKSARACLMRNKMSDSELRLRKDSTNSSLCTTSSQDVTSMSMPPLELDDHRAVFDLSHDDDDDENDGDASNSDESSQYCDSLISDAPGEVFKKEESPSTTFEAPVSSPDPEEEEVLSGESDWAKQAWKMRQQKGRVDSTTTNEVTYINTILNKSLTVTDEGNAIRRRIAADEVDLLKRQTSEDASSVATLDPPILTIEPPSPMPSPFRKNYPESDSDVTSSTTFCRANISPASSPPTITVESSSRRRRTGAALNIRHRPKITHHSHSFNSVRDRTQPRVRRRFLRSDSRSSSEPPLVVPIAIRASLNTTTSSAVFAPTTNNAKESETRLKIPNQCSPPVFHRYQEPAAVAAASSTANAAKTSSANASSVSVPGASSRHASGESEVASVSTSAVAGCSPKGYQQPQPQFISSLKMASKQAPKDGLEILEYPFLTLHSFPEGFIQRLGGLVCCRSVKLLDGELEENRMQRENWWQEIRQEIRSHARCLGCNLVIGYTEDTSIWYVSLNLQ